MNTRVLIAIIGVLVVLVGTGAGVYLVRQQQILKEKASGLTACGDTISPPTCVGKSNGSSCDISSPNDGICGGAPNCFCLLKTQISEGGTSSGGSSGPTSTTATSTLPPACSGSCSTSGGCPSGTTFTLDQSCPNVNGAHIRCCTGSSISTVVYNQCGGGLSCSATQLNGLMFPCLNGSSLVYCCPSGQIIDTGVFGATNTCHIVNSNSSGVTTVATNTLPKATNPPGWQACGSCSCVQAGVGERGNECQINDKGQCVWNPSTCGGGGGGGTPTTPSLKACGETCSSDSECYPTGANGATERCIGGICQNTSCVGKTVPGRNCDCSNLNACGQPCGATVGLCQAGSQCGFITTATQCLAAEGNTSKQFCLPTSPHNGYTVAQCSGIATIYLVNPAGQSGTPPLTQQDVLQACAPQATAQCSGIKAYDTNWNLLTQTQLSSLTAGSKVRFTVMGTATSGTFDKARFVINGTETPEVTGQKPGSSGEFYYEYTIPAGIRSFSVTGQLHLGANNTWY